MEALFGGSFDPVHVGHLVAADAAGEALDARVRFLPARVPDALMRLVDSYRVIGYGDERKETCAHLRRFFPQTEGLDKSCPADSSTATPS